MSFMAACRAWLLASSLSICLGTVTIKGQDQQGSEGCGEDGQEDIGEVLFHLGSLEGELDNLVVANRSGKAQSGGVQG